MIAANGFAQGVIDVHSHIITPEFVSSLEKVLTQSLARMKDYLSKEPDLAPFREMILYQNTNQLFK